MNTGHMGGAGEHLSLPLIKEEDLRGLTSSGNNGTQTKMNESWKNEFGRRFSPLDDNMDTQKEVEDFIENLLQQQREEIATQIKKLSKTYLGESSNGSYVVGYLTALDDSIKAVINPQQNGESKK